MAVAEAGAVYGFTQINIDHTLVAAGKNHVRPVELDGIADRIDLAEAFEQRRPFAAHASVGMGQG